MQRASGGGIILHPPPLGPVAFQCSAICRGAQTVVNEQFGWLWLYRSAEVDGNIVSRAMYKVVAYVDHWFTNLCAWMLVYNDSSISVQTCRLADLYHLLATCTHISDFFRSTLSSGRRKVKNSAATYLRDWSRPLCCRASTTATPSSSAHRRLH